MTYDISKYWEMLEKELSAYDEKYKHTTYEHAEDQSAYETARHMVSEMLRIGKEIASAWLLHTKTRLALEMDQLTLKKFGPDEIPHIKGAKSYEFANFVFLPYLKKLLEVDYGTTITFFSNVEAKKKKAKELVERLENRIKEYIPNSSKLNNQSIFSAAPEVNLNEEKKAVENPQPVNKQ